MTTNMRLIKHQTRLLRLLHKLVCQHMLALPMLEPELVYGNQCYAPMKPRELARSYQTLVGHFPEHECCGMTIDCMPVEMYLYVQAGIGGDLVMDYIIRDSLRRIQMPNGLTIARKPNGVLYARSAPAFERVHAARVKVPLKSRPLHSDLIDALAKRKRRTDLGKASMKTPPLPPMVWKQLD